MTPRTKSVKLRENRRYTPLPLAHAARVLGVSHSHLWAVVNGKRESARLMARYLELAKITAAEALANAKAGKVA